MHNQIHVENSAICIIETAADCLIESAAVFVSFPYVSSSESFNYLHHLEIFSPNGVVFLISCINLLFIGL